jgi:hypothetical protein
VNKKNMELLIEEIEGFRGSSDFPDLYVMGVEKAKKKELDDLSNMCNCNVPEDYINYFKKIGRPSFSFTYNNINNKHKLTNANSGVYTTKHMVDFHKNVKKTDLKFKNILWNEKSDIAYISKLQDYFIIAELDLKFYILIKFLAEKKI